MSNFLVRFGSATSAMIRKWKWRSIKTNRKKFICYRLVQTIHWVLEQIKFKSMWQCYGTYRAFTANSKWCNVYWCIETLLLGWSFLARTFYNPYFNLCGNLATNGATNRSNQCGEDSDNFCSSSVFELRLVRLVMKFQRIRSQESFVSA